MKGTRKRADEGWRECFARPIPLYIKGSFHERTENRGMDRMARSFSSRFAAIAVTLTS